MRCVHVNWRNAFLVVDSLVRDPYQLGLWDKMVEDIEKAFAVRGLTIIEKIEKGEFNS